VLWDEVVEQVGAGYPDAQRERVLVDAHRGEDGGGLEQSRRGHASNLFGEVLTDLAAALRAGWRAPQVGA
jgi:isocitrate/isopropylmalate dehydrogenase